MCAPNKTKKVNKAFIYLFCTHLAITISSMVSGRLGAMSRMEVFFIEHELNVNCWGVLLSKQNVVNSYQTHCR